MQIRVCLSSSEKTNIKMADRGGGGERVSQLSQRYYFESVTISLNSISVWKIFKLIIIMPSHKNDGDNVVNSNKNLFPNKRKLLQWNCIYTYLAVRHIKRRKTGHPVTVRFKKHNKDITERWSVNIWCGWLYLERGVYTNFPEIMSR